MAGTSRAGSRKHLRKHVPRAARGVPTFRPRWRRESGQLGGGQWHAGGGGLAGGVAGRDAAAGSGPGALLSREPRAAPRLDQLGGGGERLGRRKRRLQRRGRWAGVGTGVGPHPSHGGARGPRGRGRKWGSIADRGSARPVGGCRRTGLARRTAGVELAPGIAGLSCPRGPHARCQARCGATVSRAGPRRLGRRHGSFAWEESVRRTVSRVDRPLVLRGLGRKSRGPVEPRVPKPDGPRGRRELRERPPLL
mmetsp:Transcript_21656/g.48962  ORF Transcript_21656/g.48962 Transcript_21656/m.48962 type:complete len:251 (+) Transcript_21656:291-1043(+)